jgi:hypothetical protein
MVVLSLAWAVGISSLAIYEGYTDFIGVVFWPLIVLWVLYGGRWVFKNKGAVQLVLSAYCLAIVGVCIFVPWKVYSLGDVHYVKELGYYFIWDPPQFGGSLLLDVSIVCSRVIFEIIAITAIAAMALVLTRRQTIKWSEKWEDRDPKR